MIELYFILVVGGMPVVLDLDDDNVFESFEVCEIVGQAVVEDIRPTLIDGVEIHWICEGEKNGGSISM